MVDTNRRKFLAATGATIVGSTFAGCTGSSERTEPYKKSSEKKMYLDKSDFPDGWVKNDVEEGIVYSDAPIGINLTKIVLIGVRVYDSVDGAKNRMNNSKTAAAGVESHNIADNSYWVLYRDKFDALIFRDLNAVGFVRAGSGSSGLSIESDRDMTDKYARKMYQHWQSL